jgi:hypothetical protein
VAYFGLPEAVMANPTVNRNRMLFSSILVAACVTPSGLPVLVECKLWRNPQARHQVVSQILDYAKELSRWSSSDAQRESE